MEMILIGCTLQLMLKLSTNALVVDNMVNGRYLMGSLMIERPLLRLRVVVPYHLLPSVAAKKKRNAQGRKLVIVVQRKNMPTTCLSGVEWYRSTMKISKSLWRVWLHTLECLLLLFHLPCLHRRRLQHMVLQHHLKMLLHLARLMEWKLPKRR